MNRIHRDRNVPSSTSKISATGINTAARYRCHVPRVLRNVIASKIAIMPQKPLAMVKKSAR